MPRRIIVTGKQIWKARAENWQNHYSLRGQAKSFGPEQAAQVLRACARLPEPELTIFGTLETWTYDAARVVPHGEMMDILRMANVDMELLVKWYWSEENWLSFVACFNALPDPLPKYRYEWINGYPQLFPGGYPVDIPVYNSGTTHVQNRNKVAVVHRQEAR